MFQGLRHYFEIWKFKPPLLWRLPGSWGKRLKLKNSLSLPRSRVLAAWLCVRAAVWSVRTTALVRISSHRNEEKKRKRACCLPEPCFLIHSWDLDPAAWKSFWTSHDRHFQLASVSLSHLFYADVCNVSGAWFQGFSVHFTKALCQILLREKNPKPLALELLG